MRRPFITLLGALALGALALAPVAAGGPAGHGGHGHGLIGYALTDHGQLARFDTAKSQNAAVVGQITGLRPGERIVGIDFRPKTGELIAVGDHSGIYAVNPATAVATLKATLSSPSGPVALSGTSFGVDFNPTVDRLRIVSEANQNLRVNVDSGATTVDTALAYAGMDPNAGADPNAVGAAYTNNDNDEIVVAPHPPTAGKTGTQLFDIDSALDTLALQNPPNAGTLNTIGSLGAHTDGAVGFDVYSAIGPHGHALSNTAYTSLRNGVTSRLYTVALATGQVTKLGSFGILGVVDIALPPAQG